MILKLNNRTIRDLAKILNAHDLSEIEIEENDIKIRLTRARTESALRAETMIAPPAPTVATPTPPSVSPPAEPAVVDYANAIRAPMVGTLYLASDPESTPFIKVGDTVHEGQTVFIIEAMKTMNAITAPQAGVVTRIAVENAQAVEYDEVLAVLE